MRRLGLLPLLVLTGCYVEVGVGAVAGAVEPTGASAGPVFSLALGVYLEEEPYELAAGIGAGGEMASLAFDSFEQFALATAVSGYVDVTIATFEADELYLRWANRAALGVGGLRSRTGVNEAGALSLFSGIGLTWFFQGDPSFLSVSFGPYGLLLTNPGAYAGGLLVLRAGFWL